MSKHNHTDKQTSRWRKRVLGIPVVWLVGIAGTALGIVGFFIVLNVTGSVSVRDGIDVTYKAVLGPPGPVAGTPTCSFSLTNPETVDLQMSNAFPGDACQYKVEVQNAGPATAILNGFHVTNPKLTATVNHGGNQCGTTIPPTGAAGAKDVIVRITVKPTAMPGDILGFVAGDGFKFGVTADPSCT